MTDRDKRTPPDAPSFHAPAPLRGTIVLPPNPESPIQLHSDEKLIAMAEQHGRMVIVYEAHLDRLRALPTANPLLARGIDLLNEREARKRFLDLTVDIDRKEVIIKAKKIDIGGESVYQPRRVREFTHGKGGKMVSWFIFLALAERDHLTREEVMEIASSHTGREEKSISPAAVMYNLEFSFRGEIPSSYPIIEKMEIDPRTRVIGSYRLNANVTFLKERK